MTPEGKRSNIVDWYSPTANMYGCEPCPKCGSDHRASYKRQGKTVIECDCGFQEDGVMADAEEGYPE